MKVGILGAGQLGRMLALAGYPLGLEFVFLDPAPEACAAPLGEHLVADYGHVDALRAFCERIDVATYEFENVPVSAVEFVAARVPLHPASRALAVGQDRLCEKRLFEELSIPRPNYAPVDSHEDLTTALARIGMPAVLKTRRLGYDGKGQSIIRCHRDTEPAWAKLGNGQPLILESFVAFERELSCIGVRGLDGEKAFYPVIENVHRDGILYSAQPQAADPMQSIAESHVSKVLEHLGYVGAFAFEFFVAGDCLLANEIAPRVHNSGHWSIEGANCSQFENHLRAICGLPLGKTGLRGASLMLNCIGAEPELKTLLHHSGVHLHRYGKSPKPQRKLAHVTLTAANTDALAEIFLRVEPLIPKLA